MTKKGCGSQALRVRDLVSLAELLLSKGYEVHGIKRRSKVVSTLHVSIAVLPDWHDRDARLFLYFC